jgi:isoquinoline 1-oxidoreductase subunit alpha
VVAGGVRGVLTYKSPALSPLHAWAQQQAEQSRFRTVGIYSGPLGFGYNTELIAKKKLPIPKTWADLLNPASSGTAYTMSPRCWCSSWAGPADRVAAGAHDVRGAARVRVPQLAGRRLCRSMREEIRTPVGLTLGREGGVGGVLKGRRYFCAPLLCVPAGPIAFTLPSLLQWPLCAEEPEPMPNYTLNVNGQDRPVSVSSASMPLLWVLRDVLNLTGTKYGCGIEVCGACTVMMGGQREHACKIDVSSAVGKPIVTVEGLSADANGQKAQQAWIDHQVPQCGYCQPGMLMATTCAMRAGHHGSEIASELQHICVCGTYPRIKQAIAKL